MNIRKLGLAVNQESMRLRKSLQMTSKGFIKKGKSLKQALILEDILR